VLRQSLNVEWFRIAIGISVAGDPVVLLFFFMVEVFLDVDEAAQRIAGIRGQG
jgi:hypothetical protein